MTSKLLLIALVSLFCIQAFAAVQSPLYTLSNNRYLELVGKVRKAEFSDQKAGLLRKAVETYAFNCSQAWGLIESFKTDFDRISGLDLLKDNIVDPTNKMNQIIYMFNTTQSRQLAIEILADAVAARTIANPNDPLPFYQPPVTNTWNTEELTDLVKVVEKIPSSIGKIKVAEVTILSRTELLLPEQLIMLFGAFSEYKDILTIKSIIEERIVGVTCEQLVILLKRFSFENQREKILENLNCANPNGPCSYNNDLLALAEFIQGSLAGKTCQSLSPIAERFNFEEPMLALLESFSTSVLDIENKLTILDAFINKEKARKVLESFKANNYLFGSPSTKSYFILSDFTGMRASFKINSTHGLSRRDFMRNEFYRVINTFNDSMQFGCMIYTDSYSRWTSSSNMYYATRSNIQDAFKHIVDQSTTSSPVSTTNPYQALQLIMANTAVENIYLISSGYPTSGKTDFKEIIADVKKWSNGKTKVNTIALLLGTSNVDNKALTKSFMKGLADATGGTYRAFESDA